MRLVLREAFHLTPYELIYFQAITLVAKALPSQAAYLIQIVSKSDDRLKCRVEEFHESHPTSL